LFVASKYLFFKVIPTFLSSKKTHFKFLLIFFFIFLKNKFFLSRIDNNVTLFTKFEILFAVAKIPPGYKIELSSFTEIISSLGDLDKADVKI